MSERHEFPPLHVVHPSSDHKQTILMLHGLGSTGPRFADAFFASKTSRDLKALFPSMRWVFPTALSRFATGEAKRPAWFSIDSISDLEQSQQVQMEGLAESMRYLTNVMDNELATLRDVGRSRKDFFVLGRSQGSSATVWTLLNNLKQSQEIGGVVLVGSWLVFARAIAEAVCGDYQAAQIDQDRPPPSSDAQGYVSDTLSVLDKTAWVQNHGLVKTPVHISHSTDDLWIDVSLGRQIRDVLRKLGCNVEWKEFSGAAEEGHWMKEPEEFDAVADFLESRMKGN